MHGPGHAGSLSASHRPRDLHGGARILTGLAADLVIAVAARVQPGWVAPFVPGDLDGVFLEPPDKALHQTKLNKPPGDEEGREWDHNAEVSNTPAPLLVPPCHSTASRFPTYGRRGWVLPPRFPTLALPPPVSPPPSGTEEEGAGSNLSSTLWSCRV